jgi:DNA-binding transcriptional LysR family regulator
MPPFNLVSLTHALLAAEKGSFNQAALELGVRQSVVSRRIKSLEEDIGLKIFDRDRHHTSVTDQGRIFLNESKRILDLLHNAADFARSAGQGTTGEICIGVEAPLADPFLMDLLHEYREIYSKVSVQIILGSKTENIRRLTNREIDFAFVHRRPIGQDHDLMNPSFGAQTLWSTKLYVMIPKTHALCAQKIISLTSLKSDRILVGDYGCENTVNDYQEALKACISQNVHIDRHMVAREALVNFVSLGYGVTFTGAPQIFRHTKSITLKPIRGVVESLQYSGVWLPNNDNAALHKFISLAKTMAKFDASGFNREPPA